MKFRIHNSDSIHCMQFYTEFRCDP
eukprot:COSAG02_NODE_66330_length_255_cov_1.480769_1_plen_24_part_01